MLLCKLNVDDHRGAVLQMMTAKKETGDDDSFYWPVLGLWAARLQI
jgi:hypothetical protein